MYAAGAVYSEDDKARGGESGMRRRARTGIGTGTETGTGREGRERKGASKAKREEENSLRASSVDRSCPILSLNNISLFISLAHMHPHYVSAFCNQ